MQYMTTLVCWRCGAEFSITRLPMERLAQCQQCSVDLHVCRQCQYYNPKLNDKCDHDMAEPARQVDTANFCDYFRANPNAYHAADSNRANDAMAQLKALFSDTADNSNLQSLTQTTDDNKNANDSDKARFDALFKKD